MKKTKNPVVIALICLIYIIAGTLSIYGPPLLFSPFIFSIDVFIDSHFPGISNIVAVVAFAFILASALLIFALLVIKVCSLTIDTVTQSNTLDNPRCYPMGYYLFSDTRDIRHQVFLRAPRYHKAYTVLVRITYAEASNILNTMYAQKAQHYEFHKSFLMPDQVSCLQPRISKRVIIRILNSLDALESNNASAVLVYKQRFPSSNQIVNFDDAIFIEANLGRPTYTAAGVTIRSDFARASAPQSSAPPQPEQE